MDLMNAAYVISKLASYGVTTITNSKVQEITDKEVVTRGDSKGEKHIEADTVVLALGTVSENQLAQGLEGKVPELYQIGDCRKPRNLKEAILEGAHIARQI